MLYSQKEGFDMGKLLRALLSEIDIQRYKTKNVINNSVYGSYMRASLNSIIFDTFILFKGSN